MSKIPITAGERGTKLVSTVFQVGVWAVHRTIAVETLSWTVTHVPSGRSVAQDLAKPVALTLAQRLFSLSPKLLDKAKLRQAIQREEIPPEIVRVIEEANEPLTDILNILEDGKVPR